MPFDTNAAAADNQDKQPTATRLEREIRAAVRRQWSGLVTDLRDQVTRDQVSELLAQLEELTVAAAMNPNKAMDLAPEIAQLRSSLASITAATAQRIRRAANTAALDVTAILARTLTIALAGV